MAPEDPGVDVLDADVCIVGSGPAGLTVALGLLGAGRRVVVLEAGDADPADPAADRLGRLDVVGDDPYPQADADETRGCALGGTAVRWSFRIDGPDVPGRGCRYGRLDAVDLLARPDVPHSGWPLTRADLDPWYDAAHEVAGIGPAPGADDPEVDGAPRPLPGADDVTSGDFRFGHAGAFLDVAVRRLREDPHARILTGAVVTGVETAAGGGRVRGVRYVTPDGRRGRVHATVTVLAAGGIENSRLLLSSDVGRPGGAANPHDQVGRYWMEHPLVRGGLLQVRPGAATGELLRALDPHHDADGTLVMTKLRLTDDVLLRQGLVSTSALVLPRDASLVAPGVLAYRALRSADRPAPVRQAILTGRSLAGAGQLLRARQAIAGQSSVDDWGWSRTPGGEQVPVLEMVHQTEQTPDPGNRIVLAGTTDAFGRPRAVLHWRWSDEDRRRITTARDLYARAFAQAGLADLRTAGPEGEPVRMLGGNHHHMGGTRMSGDARTGVVDADCRVHGVPNLFVAGSSVFPTGGSVNPTLTILALALRLAEHLRSSVLDDLRGAVRP